MFGDPVASSSDFEIRRLSRESPEYLPTLHRVLRLDASMTGFPASQPVTDLLAAARRGEVNIDCFLGAYQSARLLTAALAIEMAGSSAIVSFWFDSDAPKALAGLEAALRAVRIVEAARKVALLEVLLEPDAAEASRKTLDRAGFHYLTRLRYLARGISPEETPKRINGSIEWVTYSPDREAVFREAVEGSYVQTLDCPELSGCRTTAQVLEGYRAIGVFQASLWSVAWKDQGPVGVVLCNRMASERGVELVYMGVAQPARGTGVADALMNRAVNGAASEGATVLALAVDERNLPARHLYSRWGFGETARREVWVVASIRA